jgi:hypothetical protein
VSQYQAAAVKGRLTLFAPSRPRECPLPRLTTWRAGVESEVVELDGMAPASRGTADGWGEGVTAMSEVLVSIADRGLGARRGGWSVGAAELTVHVPDVRPV